MKGSNMAGTMKGCAVRSIGTSATHLDVKPAAEVDATLAVSVVVEGLAKRRRVGLSLSAVGERN